MTKQKGVCVCVCVRERERERERINYDPNTYITQLREVDLNNPYLSVTFITDGVRPISADLGGPRKQLFTDIGNVLIDKQVADAETKKTEEEDSQIKEGLLVDDDNLKELREARRKEANRKRVFIEIGNSGMYEINDEFTDYARYAYDENNKREFYWEIGKILMPCFGFNVFVLDVFLP